MLSAQDAERLILDLVQPLSPKCDRQVIDLRSALGRILAEPVTSALDFPHWDNSAMDGYAVRYEDVERASSESPVTLTITEDIPAGSVPTQSVLVGQAARILTGSMMPEGADTVVMQEQTQRTGDRVTILSAPSQPQAFVRRRGTYYRGGTPLLEAGTRLLAPELAILAAAQCLQIPVYRRPKVAILSTGDELVSLDQPLQAGQIVDSNQYALAAWVEQMGAEPLFMGIVPDQPDALKAAIAQAIASADVVLSSGGVSVGDYDYVDRVLTELGATLHIRSVGVKPGKPLTIATFSPSTQDVDAPLERSPILYAGLPGNPVSALVSVWRFLQPALLKLSGLSSGWEPLWVRGRSRQALRSDGKREFYLWGRGQWVEGVYEFSLAQGSQLSGNLINLAQTNSLAMIPAGQTMIEAGEPIQILLVNSHSSSPPC